MPVPAPAMSEAMKNQIGFVMNPKTPVPMAATARPMTIRGLRPYLSDRREEKVTATTLPTANIDNATAAVCAPSRKKPVPAKADAAKSGMIELRTPKVAHPLAKKELNAAR